MGWFWYRVCLGAFLVNFACANEEWAGMEQREMDLDEILLEQREVLPRDIPKGVKKNGRPVVARPVPHSFGGASPYVLFPPGRPTLANLQAICLHGGHRPRYPPHSLPQTGFSWLRMEGNAINLVESWFGICCQEKGTRGDEDTLCCVKQAWESALNSFCEEQFSVKMRHHLCCKQVGEARMGCFQSEAPNPAYEPKEKTPVPLSSPLPGFTFNPKQCHSPQLIPRSSRDRGQKKPQISPLHNVSISFPPGRPTASNIQLICQYHKFRPRYLTKCPQGTGHRWLVRQAKAINRVEKGFKNCCKVLNNTLTCADEKWRKEMDKFCGEEKGGKSGFPCCVTEAGDERYNCFSSHAPHPDYGRVSTSTDTLLGSNISQICETDKIIKEKFPVAFLIKHFVNQCCLLSDELRTTCLKDKLVHLPQLLCSQKKPSSIILECCTTSKDISQCLSDLLTYKITKITKPPRPRKRIALCSNRLTSAPDLRIAK